MLIPAEGVRAPLLSIPTAMVALMMRHKRLLMMEHLYLSQPRASRILCS